MAYVTPATEVYLIKNCPLDVGREHTFLFVNEEAQIDYFHDNSRATHHWGDYVRINPLDNTIRIGLPYKDVYQCNYVSFRNASTLQEQKWYYAFITECNYVNEGTTEIVFSLDYMQTYMFDFAMSPCMIEREHTKTDAVGGNIVPEGLDIGEYVLNKTHKTGATVINPNGYIECKMGNDIVYLIITSFDVLTSIATSIITDFSVYDYRPVGKMYNGTGVFVALTDDTLMSLLAYIKGASRDDSIAAIFPFPACLIDWDCIHSYHSDLPPNDRYGDPNPNDYAFRLYDTNGVSSVKKRKLFDNIDYPTKAPFSDRVGFVIAKLGLTNEAIDGYTPWNNKMYTAPFCWVELDSKTGQTGLYRPELFGASIDFGFMGSPTAEPQIFAYPRNYRGIEENMKEGITKGDAYPYCPWSFDNYEIWLRDISASLAVSFATGLITAGASLTASAVGRSVVSEITRHTTGKIPQYQPARDAKGRYTPGKGSYVYKDYDKTTTENKKVDYVKDPSEGARGSISGVMSCASVLATIADHSRMPDTVRGQINNGSINQSNGCNDFWIYIKTVRGDYAQKIDDFFSRYGYAVNRFGMPAILDQTDGTLLSPSSAPRPRWNYVKTIDCKVHGWSTKSFNHDVEENLEAIFDNGITFWNPSVTMYDYTQTAQANNKPTA